MVNSRAKGARAERALSKELVDLGLVSEARRGQQFSGSPDSPDIIHDIPWLHIECKHVEKLNIHNAIGQAVKDAGDKVPAVVHKRNRGDWLVTVRLSDIPRILEERDGQ